MLTEILRVLEFAAGALAGVWPYLLVTIPLAVAVQMSGAGRHIDRAFQGRPAVAIVLATLVGAFSPFCSCSVIPVVTSLLVGGVPIAPVMSFWIASPSMDPETFFLSVATLGWKLAVWRLLGTLAMSLAAGGITHLLAMRGWLGAEVLRRRSPAALPLRARLAAWSGRVSASLAGLGELKPVLALAPAVATAGASVCCAGASAAILPVSTVRARPVIPMAAPADVACSTGCGTPTPRPTECSPAASSCATGSRSFGQRLWDESRAATLMVTKFMVLAFVIEAAVRLYVPEAWIVRALGGNNPWSILVAALVGVPVYTSNLSALPMVGALLARGMDPSAALAFLVAGPTTTLPAMAAVWGLTSRRVFALYVSFALFGALAVGYAHAWLG